MLFCTKQCLGELMHFVQVELCQLADNLTAVIVKDECGQTQVLHSYFAYWKIMYSVVTSMSLSNINLHYTEGFFIMTVMKCLKQHHNETKLMPSFKNKLFLW